MAPTRRFARLAAAIVCFAVFLTACMGDARPTSSALPTATRSSVATPSAEPTKPRPVRGGTVIVALPREPDTLNFALTVQPAARWVIDALNARLIRIRADGTYEPQLLAELPSLENGGISSDGLTWTLRFRPKLAWSDGDRLDASDFVFTWQAIARSDFTAVNRAAWTLIENVQLSNDNLTATLTLRSPSATLLEDVLAGGTDDSGGLLLPEHLLGSLSAAEIVRATYGGEEHVSSGPFRLAKWQPGEQLVLDRNEHYPDPGARLDRIIFRVIPPNRSAAGYLSTGEIDLGVDLPETSLVDLRQIPNASVYLVPKAGAVAMFAVNLNDPTNLTAPHPILSELAVRQAIVLGFDRARVVNEYLRGQTTVGVTPLDFSPWVNRELEPYPFDPQRASQMLDAAGWRRGADGVRIRNGHRLTLTHTTLVGDDHRAALRQRIQRAFIQDMAAIGIEIKARNVPAEEYDSTAEPGGIVASRGFDLLDLDNADRSGLSELAWRYSSSSIPTRFDPRGGNIMGYRDQAVDRALSDQRRTLNPEARQALLNSVQARIYEDLPVIPIYVHLEVDVGRIYVQGLEPGSLSGLWWNVEEWWINKEQANP